MRLYDITDRIDVGRGRNISVHDGVVKDGHVYFTTVDGWISIASAEDKQVVEDVDLKKVESKNTMRGWCRGLMLSDEHAFVGFSRIRKTRDSRKVRWTSVLRGARYVEEASVVCYERSSWKKLDEWRFAPHSLAAIYGVMPEPESES